MDEARRFLRYVSPGLAFGVLFLTISFVLIPHWATTQLGRLSNASGAGVALGVFLASGGLGYVFSIFHHLLHNFGSHRLFVAVDHKAIVTELVAANRLFLYASAKKGVEPERSPRLDRRTAWVITSSIWRQRLVGDVPGLNTEGGVGIKGADPGTSALMDMVHAAGTVRVAALAAFIVSICVALLDPAVPRP